MVRAAYPGYSGARPRMQLWHGTNDDTLRFANFGEEIKQWTNVHGVSQTPTSTEQNQPRSGWVRTRYGGNVEAIQETGQPHNLQILADETIHFFGLDGSTTSPPAPGTAPNGFPYCASAGSDPDGDGWGWENNRSCVVRGGRADGAAPSPAATAPNGYPYCASAGSDPDGDGWGWENSRSCVVRGGQADH